MKNKIISFTIIALMAICLPSGAIAQKYKESYYQKTFCDFWGGVTEVRLDSGTRVDCLTNEAAIEFDFAKNWFNCYAQSLFYGMETFRPPICVLIYDSQRDQRYKRNIERLNSFYGNQANIWYIKRLK